MAPSDPPPEPPDSPHKQEVAPEASPQHDEDEGLTDLNDMTLEEFLDDIYYNPFGLPPDGE